jgi:hypothetical protein
MENIFSPKEDSKKVDSNHVIFMYIRFLTYDSSIFSIQSFLGSINGINVFFPMFNGFYGP